MVPTHNRPHFLRRLLRFYSRFQPDFPLLVVDSSESSAAAENVAALDAVRENLQIQYRHMNLGIIDKCIEGLRSVQSPFVVFCADDDFLFPGAVWRCVDFLETEPSFASAMGRTAMLDVKHLHGWCKVLKGYSIEDDLPIDRCRWMAQQWFSNFYAVHRTEERLSDFQIKPTRPDPLWSMSDTMLCQMSVLRGRLKVLPQMYALRERHGDNAGTSMRHQRTAQAELRYKRFLECMADQIERAGIDRTEVEQFMENSYGYSRGLNWENRKQQRSAVESIRHHFRGIVERAVDCVWTHHTRHRRFVRASDYAGDELIWDAAVQLMRDYPQGAPSEPSVLKRCG